METVIMREPNTASVDFAAIPSHQTDAMCRTVIGAIARLFEDPAVQADYQKWKKEREATHHIQNKR